MFNRKTIALLFTCIMVLAMLSTTLAAPKTKIVIWTWSQEQSKFFEEMEAKIEAKYPDIDVQYTKIVQAQYRNSLPLAFRGDNAPDIFFESNTPSDMVGLGFARPLDEFMTKSFINQFPEEYFYEGVCRVNGKICALPQSNYKIARPIYFYYNKDVMKKAGLNPNKPPKTWSELREMAKKITIAGKGEYYGLAMTGKPAHDLERTALPLASTLGLSTGNTFDWKTGKWAYDNPRWIQLYEFLKALKDDGSFFPGFASMDKTLARTYFAQNKAAFFMDGLWLPATFVSMGYPNLNYGVAPPPVPDNGREGYCYLIPTAVPMWYMSSQTKYPKEAWKVMSFFYSDEYQRKFVENNFGYSPLKNFKNDKYVQDPHLKEIIKMAPDISRLGVIPTIRNPKASLPIFNTVNTVHPTIWELMTSALMGEGDFKIGAAELNKKLTDIFESQLKEANLSKNDFIFKNWDPIKDYTIDMYKTSK